MATVKKIKEGLFYISWDAPQNPSPYVGGSSRQGGQHIGNPIQIQVDVSTLTDVVDSFVFTCQTEQDEIVLEMEIYIANKAVNWPASIQPGPVPPSKPDVFTYNPSNLAFNLGTGQRQSCVFIQKPDLPLNRRQQLSQRLIQVSGRSSQSESFPDSFQDGPERYVPRRDVTDPLETASRTRNTTNQFEWETILIYATKDHVQQMMTYNQSKWRATWDVSTNSGNSGCQRCKKQIRCNYCGKSGSLGFDILIDLNPESVISIKKGSQHVLDHLLNLWNTKTLSDVTFNCQGKSIKAHTLILASGSPILAAMFQHNSRENQQKVVAIKDTNLEVFEELLCYIYTGNFNSGRNVDVAELLIAADTYAVETLKEECALILSRKLKVGNAARYLVLSYDHHSPKLYEASIDFITKNAKAVCSRKDWMTIIKNYPEICFQVTQLMLAV
jgi:speckle-type POZ protein